MSNFACEHCGTILCDSPTGYTTECEHYPMEKSSSSYVQDFRHKPQVRFVDFGNDPELMCDECGTTDPDDFIQDSLFESLCIACIQEAEMTELNDDYPWDLDPTEELNFEDGNAYNHCSPLVDVRDWE